MSCNNENGCVVGLDKVIKHGVESCQREVVDVKPVRKTGVEKPSESDKA